MSDYPKESNENESALLPGYKNFEEYTKEGYRALMEAIRNSNALPSSNDWDFYSTFESFNKAIDEDGDHILKLINTVLRHQQVSRNIRNRGLNEKTELIVDANDVILERVAGNIDEMNGIKKTFNEPVQIQTVSAKLPVSGAWNRINSATFSVNSTITSKDSSSQDSIQLLTAKNVVRPQNFFKDVIHNSATFPWEPRIKEKPNSIKPLAIFLEETENGQEYSHPYEFELNRFSPYPDQLVKEEPTLPTPTNDTPLIEVNEPEQIDALIEDLRNCKVFAVDLEHHSYRSFMGFTCLMQISTNTADYIIDTLALRDKLYLLNEVFTKPSIVKIFHGADSDILWLQRDLSLYVVNMFDTHQASKVLNFSSLSLASLMKRYCNFVPDKKFQLADWRIRPLPEELKVYAREDTHYLIYIYQMMKNELLSRANGQDNLLRSVISKSTEICKRRYLKPGFREDSFMDFYRRCKRLFDNRQLYALKELYKWRDLIAREEDESTGYVLPNHMLLQISETLPREMQGILACCNPIPPLVRANLLELHKMILKAREQPVEKPIFKEDIRAPGAIKTVSKIDYNSKLHCPHDMTQSNEFRDDLPTLLGNPDEYCNDFDEDSVTKTASVITVFSSTYQNIKIEDGSVKRVYHDVLGPFERYNLVKPYIQEEERRLEAERAKKAANGDETQSKDGEVEADSNADRVETIRLHFLSLCKLPVPETKPNAEPKSLVEMGGTKKRKRDESTNVIQIESDIHTTIPSNNYNVHHSMNSRKRKHDELGDQHPPPKHPRHNNNKFNKKNKKKQGNRNWQSNEAGNSAIPQQTNCGGRFPPRANVDHHDQYGQSFTPYDYSSVDFNQFQGGATQGRTPQKFKSNFKSKGKNLNRNKNNNRSSNFKSQKSHRGTER